jgi:integrase
MLREDNVRQGFFTRAEVLRLCKHLAAPLNSFVMFAFLTGWRLSEIRGLLWRNVDFKTNEIRLEPGTTKSGEGRTFPMSEELRKLLWRLWTAATRKKTTGAAVTDSPVPAPALDVDVRIEPAKPPALAGEGEAGRRSRVRRQNVATITAPHVFVIDGLPIGEFRKSWATACHKAGLPCIVHLKKDGTGNAILAKQRDGKGKPLIDRIVPLRIFHDLRRSAVRELVRTHGLSEREAMMLTGHKTRSVFDRYSVVSQADLEGIRRKLNATHLPSVDPKAGRKSK